MSQSTGRRIRDQINLLRDQPQLPFNDLLDAEMVEEVLQEEGVRYRDRIYTPLVTLWTFLSQVLSLDHCCRKAVAGFRFPRRFQAPQPPKIYHAASFAPAKSSVLRSTASFVTLSLLS